MNNELPILYPCHLHSWFSLADSCVSPQKLVKRMQELGLNKTAITDHGNVVHVIRFGSKLKENNLTLYPGEEFYYCDDVTQKDKDHRAAYHLTIVAYTQEGLSTLYSLSSLSYAEGFYFKPKIDIKMLREHNKGIRVSSACIKGQIAENIINDDYESAKAVAKAFKEIFGGNFYLEIMPHDLDEQRKANLGILKISQELDIPLLATYDAHMCWKNETKYRRFLMQMTKAGWADGDEELGMTDTIYMMSAQEYLDYFAQYHPDFPQDKVIEAIANTEKYLGNEVVELEDDTCIFPKIDIPAPYKDDLDYIRHLLWNSMKEKGLDKNQKYIDRVKMELEIMNNDGFVPYFLVLYDVFNWCRKNHVMTGAGRGCFTEDALVLTNNGLKYIKDVTTGDKVITADGKFEQVLETHKYPINEETIQFNYLYNGNAINRCTKDHKILVNRNGVVDYIKAEELHLGDLLCSPKIKAEEDTKQYVDLNEYNVFGFDFDDNYIYEKKACNQTNCSQYGVRKVARAAGLSGSTVRIAFHGTKKIKQETIKKILSVTPFKTIDEWRAHVEKSKYVITKIKRKIEVTKDFSMLIGLLYGDGFTSKGGLSVGLAINSETKKNTVNRKVFEDFANSLGDHVLYENKSKQKKLVQLYVNSKVFTNYIQTEFFKSEKSKEKSINSKIIFQKKELIKSFVDGLLSADGYEDNAQNRICFDNTSKSIIGTVKIVNSILNKKPARITIRRAHKDARGLLNRESYKLTWRDTGGTNIASDDNYWYLPVTEIIKHQKEELFVYDLTIANNPSYTLNNIIVHNSGAASLMNYLLGITRIDPLKFDLRFDRFYNSGRKGADGAPDVDSDFADARREEVIKYTEEKYGADKISQICNISTMKLKSCIKDCARVLKVPFAEANAITNKIDWDAFESLDEAKEDKVAGAIIRKYSEVFEYVEYFLGFPRQFGKHAAGIIIANRRIGDICPMMLSEVEGKKFLISQFDKDDVHKTGLIKFDYLGLSTLTFLTHILDDIKRTTGKDIDLDSLDVEDKAVYKNILATADTDNVFQMESGGMKAYLKRLSPDRFGDLSALNSLYRPAGIKSGAIDNYINNKYNKPKTYGVKELDDLLAKTNFVICYDEIKMDIVGTFGKFPPKDINKFRKSSGKKDPKSMQYCQDMKPMFVENAQKHGLTAEQASSLYDSLIGYAFCKAHADCYSLLTFWTAWLKYYYPVNFLHASFTFSTTDVEKDKYSIKTAIKMAKKMGYRFVSVDVNKSKANFSFDDENKIIYWSMRNIKQVSEDIAKKIEENQPYVDFNDFVARGKEFGVSKRVIDPLVVLGAFDSLNCPEQIKEWYIKNNKLKKADRESLGIETKEAELEHIENKFNVEIIKRSMQDKENEYLGLVISMDSVDFQVVKRCINNEKFRKLKDRDSCSLYGILTKKELKKSKSGGNYGVLTIMDPDYNFYTIQVGSKAYAQLEQSGIPSEYKLEEGRWVMLNGSKCDETRLFLNGTQIVDLKEYERKVLNGIIKEKMVFQA